MNKLRLFLLAILCVAGSAAFAEVVNIRISDSGGSNGDTFQINCDNAIQNPTSSTGTYFWDSGESGNYSTNESYRRQLASTNSGAISVRFTQFNLATGSLMTIKDAISQEVLVSNASGNQLNNQTITSTHGALDFIWTSGSTAGAGFKAVVFCGDMCQTFTSAINITGITPHIVGEDTYYDVCNGTAVNFNVVNTFPQNGQEYQQTDGSLVYNWRIINANNDTTRYNNAGQSFSHTFDVSGGFYVYCDAVDNRECYNRDVNKKKIRVSIAPTWERCHFGPDSICPGTQVSFHGEPHVEPWRMEIPDIVAGTTFLPDGNSTCYNTSLEFDIFPDGATVTSANDIDHVHLNMEHSYFGDLSIMLQCPSGRTCLLHAYSGGTMSSLHWSNVGGTLLSGSSGGGGYHLGLAPDPSSSSSNCYYTPGEGYNYDIYPNGTVAFGSGSPTITYSYTDPCGSTQSSSIVKPSEQLNAGQYYGPYERMSSLVGCPLNGVWTIYVCDHLSSDNGYIFEWGLYFAQSLYPDNLWTFTNTYQTSTDTWSGNGITSGQNGSADMTAVVQNPDPNNASLIPYTFSATDDFGCTYDTTLTVHVLSSLDPQCCIEPTPTAATSNSQPCGNSVTLTSNNGQFCVNGNTGEWTYTGPGTATFDHQHEPSTTVTVNAYGDYTFTWHEYYQGNTSCNGSSDVSVNFARVMDATLAPLTSCCRSASMMVLTAPDFGTLSISPSSAAFNTEARTFTPTSANPGTYTITNRIDGERCAQPNTSSQTFTIYDELAVNNRTEDCSAGADAQVTVGFNVVSVAGAGLPPSYTVSGSFVENQGETGELSGTVNEAASTSSSWSHSGGSPYEYTFVVQDVHECSSVTVSSYRDCGCPNVAGTFDSHSPRIMCTGQTCTLVKNNDFVCDEGAQLYYVISTDATLENDGSNVLHTYQTHPTDGITVSMGDIPGGAYNVQYYLYVISGYATGPFSNRCHSISQPVPLMWKETPQPNVTAHESCGLVMTLEGSELPTGMTGYWTATGPEGVTNYTYTTIQNTTNNQRDAMVLASHYGEATYTWNVVNAECVGSASAIYNFRQIPNPEAGPDRTVCGTSYEIMGAHQTRPLIENSTITWTGNGVTMSPATGSIQPTANANTSGTYTITLTERNGECAGSDDVHITFVAIPMPATTANVDTVCGHTAELIVYNTNPANEGRWTAYDDSGIHTQSHVVNVTSYQQYGNPNAPSNDRYTHCFATVEFPNDATEVTYEFVWSEPISDPRLPADADCAGEAIKRVVFRKLPAVSVHICGSTGDVTSVCGNSVELCAETAASDGYSTYSWLCKDINGHFSDSLSTSTSFTLDTTVTVSRYRDVHFYFVARNRECMVIDTMTVRFLEKPVANAGIDHAACGRDYILNGAWSLAPSTDSATFYTPSGSWTTISKPGPLNPTWTNTPHDSIIEPVHVNQYGVYTFQFMEINTAGNASDCWDTASVVVEFMEQPVVNAGVDFNVCGLDFTMHAITSHEEGDSITGSWTCMSGGNAAFVDRTDPQTDGHFSSYGPATFRWIETNHPHIHDDNPQTCAAFDEVVITFYEIPSAAINMNPADTATCGLETSRFPLRADATGSNIQGYWYEVNPSTQFGPQNSTVNSTVSDVSVSSYGRHDFYWIEYNGPQDNPRFCKDTAGPWTIEFLREPVADILLDSITFCSYDGQLHVDYNGTPSAGYYPQGGWSSSVPSSVVRFDDISNPNTPIHTTILNSDNPSYPYFTLYWTVQNTEYCTDEDSIRVIFARVPSDSIKVIPPKCFGEAAVLTAFEDTLARYDWDYGNGYLDTTHLNNANGEFRAYIHWEDKEEFHTVGLTATNAWGCVSNIGQVTVEEPEMPKYSHKIIMDTCALGKGGIEFIDTTNLYAFFWIDTTVGPIITNPNTGYAITDMHIYDLPQGRYTYRSDYQSFNRDYFASYYEFFGDVYCHDYPTFEIGTIGIIETQFAIDASVDLENLVAPEATVIFRNSTNYDGMNNKRCEWHFGDGIVEKTCDENVEHVYVEPGCYEPYLIVMNRDLQECRDTAYLDECVFVDKESKLEIPNIFSPNGDGINDYFQVVAQTLKTFHGKILNRYGRVVYEWEDWENEDAGWDGRLNGSTKGTPGVYYYIIEAVGFDGHEYKEEGALHLVR